MIKEKKDYRKIILQIFILFFFEFSVSLFGLSMRRVVFVLCVFLILRKQTFKINNRILNAAIVLGVALCFILLYLSYILLVYGNSIVAGSIIYFPTRLIYLYLNIIIFPLLLLVVFGNIWDFFYAQKMVILFQAIISLLGKISNRFALFIYAHFYSDQALLDGVQRGVRSIAIDCGGATGSVIMFVGCLIIIGELLYCTDKKEKNKLLIQYFLIVAGTMFIARTGFYFEILLLLGYGIYTLQKDFRMFKTLMLWFAGVCSVCIIYLLFSKDSYLKQQFMEWTLEIFTNVSGEGSFYAGFFNMPIPRLSWETFRGTGIFFGSTTNQTIMYHDSGYLRIFSALGLPMSILYYGIILWFYLFIAKKIKNKKFRKWMYVFLIFIFVIEIKEPFIGKTPLVMILSCISFLSVTSADKNIFYFQRGKCKVSRGKDNGKQCTCSIGS